MRTLVLGACLLGSACAAGGHAAHPRVAAGDTAGWVVVERLPPAPKDVFLALMRSAEVPLSVDASCRNAGVEWSDRTIGEYVSGFIVLLDERDARNDVKAEARARAEGEGWVGRVMLGHAQGEEVWQWGVEFLIDAGGAVDPASFRCLGAG